MLVLYLLYSVNIELQRERDTANRRVLELEKKLRVAQSELAKERLAREALEKVSEALVFFMYHPEPTADTCVCILFDRSTKVYGPNHLHQPIPAEV